MGREACEEAGSQHKRKAQAAVLDARFDGERATVAEGNPEGRCHAKTNAQRQCVVNEHHQEDVADALEEGIDVAAERQHHHGNENHNGEPLQGDSGW